MPALGWDASARHHAARTDRSTSSVISRRAPVRWVGRMSAGPEVHGSLWVQSAGVRAGALSEPAADGLVATLVREGARYPLQGHTFLSWARRCGLL